MCFTSSLRVLLCTLACLITCLSCDRRVVSVIDSKGNVVPPPRESWVNDFCDGLDETLSESEVFQSICKGGDQHVLSMLRTHVYFQEGFLPYPTHHGWVFLDKQGRIAISGEFQLAMHFSEGLAAVLVEVSELNHRWGYINSSGKFVVSPIFEGAFPFSEGLAIVRVDGKMGAIDRKGILAIPPVFHTLNSFSEGLALAEQMDTGNSYRGGYIDRNGEFSLLLPNTQAPLSGFSNGLALVRVFPHRYAFIDKTGRIKISLEEFDGAEGFSEGLAGVSKDNRWGFMDTEGRLLVPPQYLEVFPYRNGHAVVVK